VAKPSLEFDGLWVPARRVNGHGRGARATTE